ncbi:MAG: nuclear transport factor 2 family protein [Verrucomicrobiota bacterium]
MKNILIAFGLIFVWSTPFSLSAQNAITEDPAHQELRQLRDGLLAAMNKSDIEATLQFLHTNVVVTWHNAEVSRGHEGVRAYNNRVMTGPSKIVESFKCDVKVDELTSLYGDKTGICYGSSDEHFVLVGGKKLDLKGRWTATLVKENGRWLIASLHASTNLFDNVMLDIAKKTAWIAAIASLLLGIVGGWLIGRRRKAERKSV